MKILVIDNLGEAYRHIGIYRSLAAMEGKEITLLVPKESFGDFSTTASSGVGNGSVRVLFTKSLFPNRSHRSILLGLWKILWREKFDILYVDAEPESYQALHAVIGRARFSRGTKLVLMSWRNIDFPSGVYPFRAPGTHAMAERITVPRIDGLVAHNGTAQELFQSRGVSLVTLIPPAVDVSHFQPGDNTVARAERGVKKFSIGYVGRFVHEKGIDLLLRASARLPMDHEILLLGKGSEESRLRKLSDELNISHTVRWVGHVSYGLLPEFYRAMDVAVLPSRTTALWKEQFGRVLIEAMACGVPVIGSDSGEIPATIGDCGLVFPEGDVDALVAAITELHQDPLRRKEIGDRGRSRAIENFSTTGVANMYRNIFEAVRGK